MSKLGYLTTKILGKSVSALGKTRTVPEGAVTYDFIKGVSIKRGKFEIFSYKDAAGKIIAKDSTYRTSNNLTNEWKYFNYFDGGRRTSTWVSNNIDDFRLANDNCIMFDTTKKFKDAWMFDIKPRNDLYDFHKISYLSPGKKSKNISFGTCYDGETPFCINITGTRNRTLAKRNREYLPLITSGYLPNVERKISHISAIQEKKFNFEDIIPPLERVPQSKITEELGENIRGSSNMLNGKIEITDEAYSSRKLLEYISHEYKHSADAFNIRRLPENVSDFRMIPKEQLNLIEEAFPGTIDFTEKAIKRGVIKPNTNSYQRIKAMDDTWDFDKALPWEERPQEIRAIKASVEQLERYDSCWNSLKNLFGAKFTVNYG